MQLIVLELKEWRAAAIEIDNEITDIWAEPLKGVKPAQGDIILGRVSSVLDGKSAAFISLGSGKPGLLNSDELVLAQHRKTAGGAKPAVSECLEEEQAILIQVKHPGSNRKGPIITELVHLTGQMLVYMPYANYSAVSKQLSSRREQLLAFAQRNCVEGEGLIFRTGAGYASETQLQEELEKHREEWYQIQVMAADRRAPSLLKKAGGLSEQIGSLYPLQRVKHLVTNSSSAAKEFLGLLSTDVDVSIVQQRHKLISKLEETIANLKQTVKIGKANLHIEETNALTAIDVDTGGANFGSKNETHYGVNIM
ncbi:MAG: ribonuclease E/G, partial [Anaerobacillus sp.]